jgi:hypothetical protein
MLVLTTATLAAVAAVLWLSLLGHRAMERDARRRDVENQLARIEHIARAARISQRLTTNGLR